MRPLCLPLVLLEAESCGVPVVATDIPGNRECVVDGKDGVLLSPNDDRAFSTAINRILGDDKERRNMAIAARSKIERQFDISARVQRVTRVYEELLERPLGSDGMCPTLSQDEKSDKSYASAVGINSSARM